MHFFVFCVLDNVSVVSGLNLFLITMCFLQLNYISSIKKPEKISSDSLPTHIYKDLSTHQDLKDQNQQIN